MQFQGKKVLKKTHIQNKETSRKEIEKKKKVKSKML